MPAQGQPQAHDPWLFPASVRVAGSTRAPMAKAPTIHPQRARAIPDPPEAYLSRYTVQDFGPPRRELDRKPRAGRAGQDGREGMAGVKRLSQAVSSRLPGDG